MIVNQPEKAWKFAGERGIGHRNFSGRITTGSAVLSAATDG